MTYLWTWRRRWSAPLAPIVPNPATTPVNTEIVVLNKTVKTFNYTAISLTLDGNPVALNSSVTVTPVTGATMPTYQISGLAPFTTASGTYVLTVDASKIVDYATNPGVGTASVSWTEAQAIADVTITNTVDNATPQEGSLIHFTVTLTNAGPADATDVSVLDALPSGLTLVSASGPGTYDTTTGVWSIAQIDAGSNATLTLTATVNLGTGGQTLETVASITGLDQTDDATPTSAEQDVTVRATTLLSMISGSGTYGGTATLMATLTADGSGVANEPVNFAFINGTIVTTVGMATTNADGVATLTGVSLAGIGAGTDTGYVGASFAGDPNDVASSGSGDLDVAQAPLSVTANPASKTYGDPDPIVHGVLQRASSTATMPLRLAGRLSFATTEPSTGYAPVGTYTITPSGLTSSNYSDHLRRRHTDGRPQGLDGHGQRLPARPTVPRLRHSPSRSAGSPPARMPRAPGSPERRCSVQRRARPARSGPTQSPSRPARWPRPTTTSPTSSPAR